jgi:hypothetical protein
LIAQLRGLDESPQSLCQAYALVALPQVSIAYFHWHCRRDRRRWRESKHHYRSARNDVGIEIQVVSSKEILGADTCGQKMYHCPGLYQTNRLGQGM